MLKKSGIIVNEEKATEYLNTMYFLARLVVQQTFADGIDQNVEKED